MATVIAPPPALSGDLSLFHTTDPLLGNNPVLVFYGPAATIGATSSRIQVHVFTPAGLGSYARLSVSPNSPFYSAVSNLPREEQGDEVCRGLAFGLKKYFTELGEGVKKTWTAQVKAPSPGALFGDDHIAILATRMTKIENVDDVIGDILDAFCEQRLSWVDVDVVLPPGSIKERPSSSDGAEDLSDLDILKRQFGRYAELVQTFGEITFLPTSRLKRAPSKANAIGRTASFLRSQKENVRKQLGELVGTEQNYVNRMKELQDLSNKIGADLKDRHQQQLALVFSPSIGKIVELNSAFSEEISKVVESTDSPAQEDIESSQDDLSTQQGTPPPDSQGLDQVAQCLCEWLPHFAEAYQEYMSSHAQASQTLRTLLRAQDSLAQELQEIGEQKLTSLLIEPIQRLPRYNLYIDSIAKQLPVKHPALKPLLKARDIVTGICAENEGTEAAAMVERLRTRTMGWPLDIDVSGRLVAAVDYLDLMPPYAFEGCDGARGMLFLFTDGVIMVEKSPTSKASARTLLTEMESGSLPSRSVESLSDTIGDLHFVRRLQLDALQCTESHDGSALQFLTFFQLAAGALGAQEPILDSCQLLKLEGAYDGRVSRFVEEVAKARVESRFSEAERESSTWEFRATDPATDSLNLLSAIFDDSNPQYTSSRGPCAPIRIVVDAERHQTHVKPGHTDVRTVINLASHRDGDWRLTIDSVDGNLGREHVDTPDLVPALRRKIASLTSARLAIEQPAMAACMIMRNSDILQSIGLQAAGQADYQVKAKFTPRERVHRPKSPKKLLSSFLSSVGPGNEPPNLLHKHLPSLPPQSQIPRMPSHASSGSYKPPSRESRPTSKEEAAPFAITSDLAANQLKKMEDTLSAYVLALQARKGNIVGKNLKLRLVADPGLVEELYTGLLEDPNMMVLAAQAPLDVLMASFEKFLNIAWKDHIGQVMPTSLLQDIQAKAEALFPSEFDEYFKNALGRLAPQNQRAFKAIMKLLADLLDGTGNDGDRGILTACFAEVLVTEGNPHDYIALIDRFVDDTDTYFGEPVDVSMTHSYKDTGSVNSHKRARSINSGSLTSNTSSLRRKFGLGGLTRENSKSEQESKVASVWRTLSKSTRGDYSPGNSISKGSLGRSRSIDTEPPLLGMRPPSQDSKVSTASFGDLPNLVRTPSSHNLGLSTIGEHPSFIPQGPPRKKRRSSLSDLKVLETSPKREPWSPPSPRRPVLTQKTVEEKALPDSPAPSTPSGPSSRDNTGRFGSPLQKTPRSRLPSSFRRELSPGPSRALGSQPPPELPRPKTSGGEKQSELQRPKTSGGPADEVVITSRPTSNIPSLVPRATSPAKLTPSTPNRTGLSERPGAGNIVKKPSPQTEKIGRTRSTTVDAPGIPQPSPTRKLRMQSPQKLRERLQNEQSSIAAAQSSIQDELSKIGDELTSSTSMRSPVRGGSRTIGGRGSFSQASNMDLAQRVLKMEGTLPKQISDLNTRVNTIQNDLSTSLTVSETKCKKLDELYREANGENEALYSKFNEELSRILKAVRGGEGVEELKKKLKEAQDEVVMLRRESSRLKRENVGLRAQLKE
ncbi:Phosphatidylinositol 3,4,5-trisphosphate-dependent Rac exchanger 1 protein [Pseudocercospora fuligena]|uniref:Phosphatidylinositol 3,4,5-trisphosphate-dependent Rac exchanger 1 protein n=1 Tax=Pseudocercospora fuligena TaxID=685502 RepID=A0A8H6R722_9PEZI|nr:Phosphatidylinositol 3,4,5-trisphosphate-dependent Rac exchanger 1 protein [Pseudocercospora fuligena]